MLTSITPLFSLFYCSLSTEQTHVALYMTAVASQSHLVQKPTIKVIKFMLMYVDVFQQNGFEIWYDFQSSRFSRSKAWKLSFQVQEQLVVHQQHYHPPF